MIITEYTQLLPADCPHQNNIPVRLGTCVCMAFVCTAFLHLEQPHSKQALYFYEMSEFIPISQKW